MDGLTIRDRYRLGTIIGAGHGTTVYRAVDTRNGLDTIVKLLVDETALTLEFNEKFAEIMQPYAQLDHETLVPVLDYGLNGTTPFIVLGNFDRPNLEQEFARSGPMPTANAAIFMKPLAQAIDYLNNQNLTHLDIKLSNVWLAGNTAYLSDYFMAALRKQMSEIKMGKAHTDDYTSEAYLDEAFPELYRGEPLTGATDQYGLAVVLYRLMTGVMPYNKPQSNANREYSLWIETFKSTPVPDPRHFRPDLPVNVSETLLRALAVQQGDRFASSGEFIETFTRCVQNPTYSSSGSIANSSPIEQAVVPPIAPSQETLTALPVQPPVEPKSGDNADLYAQTQVWQPFVPPVAPGSAPQYAPSSNLQQPTMPPVWPQQAAPQPPIYQQPAPASYQPPPAYPYNPQPVAPPSYSYAPQPPVYPIAPQPVTPQYYAPPVVAPQVFQQPVVMPPPVPVVPDDDFHPHAPTHPLVANPESATPDPTDPPKIGIYPELQVYEKAPNGTTLISRTTFGMTAQPATLEYVGQSEGLGPEANSKFVYLLQKLRDSFSMRHSGILAPIDMAFKTNDKKKGEEESTEKPFCHNYVVFPRPTGQTLRDRINALNFAPVPLGEINFVLSQLAPALDFAHWCGIEHGRLCPENILRDERNLVVVRNFGIDRLRDHLLSQPPEQSFTSHPEYCSPEEWSPGPNRMPDMSIRVGVIDQYSVGLIVYEMLTGRNPLKLTGNFSPTWYAIPDVRQFYPLIPAAIANALNRAMALDWRMRYGTVGEFATAFRRAAGF